MTPFNFLLIFVLLNLTFARSHTILTKEELHWKLIFPNTPMPKVLRDILPKSGQSTIFTSKVDTESKGVNDLKFVVYSNANKDHSHDTEDDPSDANYDTAYDPPDANYDTAYDPPDANYDTDYNYDYEAEYNWNYNYDHHYGNDADESRVHDHAPNNKALNDSEFGNKYSSAINETIYFFQETLLPGNKVNLPRLTQRSDKALFLPQQIAESIPMSSDKLQEILKIFSLKVESSYANNVKKNVMSCERAEMKGEEKYCATSLESFVDLSVSMLGKNIKLLSHQLGKELKSPLFTIGLGKTDMGDNNIICHKMKYSYAVYLCHSIKKTTVYEVPLMSIDRTKSIAVAVCHKDTSAWSPNHIAFRFLKIKPGSIPICHFIGRDTIVWVHSRVAE